MIGHAGKVAEAAPFPGYESAFQRLEPSISRLLDLSRVQELLLSMIGDAHDTVTLFGDHKEAVWFIASEIRDLAGQLDRQWTDLHNAGVDQEGKHSGAHKQKDVERAG